MHLTGVGDTAVLSVADDGEWRQGPEGLGIATVRGMLEAVGGDLSIRSRNGSGTTVVARVPVKDKGR